LPSSGPGGERTWTDPEQPVPEFDASNAVRLCDRCEAEEGIGAGADKGDRSCAACGNHATPHIYPTLAELKAAEVKAERAEEALRELHEMAEMRLTGIHQPSKMHRGQYEREHPHAFREAIDRARASLSRPPEEEKR
jgi:hypothetical protein